MADYVLKDAQVYYDEYNLSGLLNQVSLNWSADLQDATVLGDGTRERLGGLKTAEAEHNGFWDSSEDLEIFSQIGASAQGIMSIAPYQANVGDPAYFFRSRQASYNQNYNLGEIFNFTLNVMGDKPLVRGYIGAVGTKSVTGQGSSIILPAVAADETLYAALHAVNSQGDSTNAQTLDVRVVSDADGVFDSTANTRISFSQVTTAIAAEWASVAGAITDTFWRIEWDVAGAAASFDLFVVFGIASNI